MKQNVDNYTNVLSMKQQHYGVHNMRFLYVVKDNNTRMRIKNSITRSFDAGTRSVLFDINDIEFIQVVIVLHSVEIEVPSLSDIISIFKRSKSIISLKNQSHNHKK